MTRHPCCGPTALPTLRGSWSSVRGARAWRAVPVRWHSVPHRGYPTPMYRPELCARPGVSFASPPVPLPPVALGSLGAHAPAIGYPMTPHVYSWASALGLWGTGNRVRGFPDHRRRGKTMRIPHHPRPHFRNTQPQRFSHDLSGSPNHHPQGPPWVCVDRDRATASQPSRSPLSAGRAPIS
jgi:hypothetical protein